MTKEQTRKYNQEYRKKHHDELLEYDRNRWPKRYETNRESKLAQNKKWQETNREKHNFLIKRWAKANPQKRALTYRKNQIKRRYGITYNEYLEMILKQGNKCKICEFQFTNDKMGGKPFIDHCHNTGKVRGILCHSCNIAIGNLKDSVELMEKAIQYIKENS